MRRAVARLGRRRRLHVHSLLAQAPGEVDAQTGALTPPIHLSTTFERDADGSYPRGFVYSRVGNPTRALLEKTAAQMEGGSEAAAFSSGMAAVNAIFQGLLRPGDTVALADDVYHGTRSLLQVPHPAMPLPVPSITRHSAAQRRLFECLPQAVFENWGVRFEPFDVTSAASIEAALSGGALSRKPSLLWAEMPSNPMLKLVDVEAAAALARAARVPFVVDATWATPCLVRPLELGADLTVHASTKYLGGHSDMLGGLVVGAAAEPMAKVRAVQHAAGAVASPFDCWLTLRGLRSLAPRMALHSANGLALATHLEQHPRVAAVHYPGLRSHPQHALAQRLMQGGFGGMLSVQVRGGEKAALEFAARTRLFARATSLGGTESLIEHRASIEPEGTTTPRDLLRLSVGLEHEKDLIADLDQALEGI